jgi:copper homeostasis protein
MEKSGNENVTQQVNEDSEVKNGRKRTASLADITPMPKIRSRSRLHLFDVLHSDLTEGNNLDPEIAGLVSPNIKKSKSPAPLLEICIDNVMSGIAAKEGGARRLELCSSLSEGGLTPSVGFLTTMKKLVDIPVFAMIRPRGGDFIYSAEEIQVMKEDIRLLKEFGANGFVFGVLNEDAQVDESKCKELMAEVGSSHPVTFHRAFDYTPDPLVALETIISLGFARILTSGQKCTALLGKNLIRQVVEQANGRITIMAGAGINQHSVNEIVDETKVCEIHGSCSRSFVSSMKVSTDDVITGGIHDEMNIFATDAKLVKRLLDQFEADDVE